MADIDKFVIITKEHRVCGTYVIYNKVNGKYYIGSSNSIYDRMRGHRSDLRNNKHSNVHLQCAWNKYTEANFLFCNPIITRSAEEAMVIEKYLIELFDACNDKNGYNISPDPFFHIMSEETKKKISKAHMGKKLSAETRAKMSKSRMGKKLSPEHIQRLKEFNTGRKHTEETKRKISESKRNKTNVNIKIRDDIFDMFVGGISVADISKKVQHDESMVCRVLLNYGIYLK